MDAAEALKITAPDLLALNVIDEIVKEPIWGAHRDYEQASALISDAVARHLSELDAMTSVERLDARYAKFRGMGQLGRDFADDDVATHAARRPGRNRPTDAATRLGRRAGRC